MKAKILLLGATGSVGSQTLEIIEQFPEHFEVSAIAAWKDSAVLNDIREKHAVKHVFCGEREEKRENGISLAAFCKRHIDAVDIVVHAISGMAGIHATEEIITHEKPLCLANKESIVARGEWIMKQKKCRLIPLDSEHSSMDNLMSKVSKDEIKKVWLTASGGPFRDKETYPLSSFSNLTASQAVQHPNWNMGAKISVDSSTLMNKAFEYIEAVRLFSIAPEKIQVVVHPESIIHAAVETHDGNILMEASQPTMLLPIARGLFQAIEKPIPKEFSISPFSPYGKTLTFEEVDTQRFPSIEYAQKALSGGDNTCRQLLSANDESVELFIAGNISFAQIFTRLQAVFSED